jgi:predicted O-linked N-acetylglucosamine transferase (SPINDLY family)
MQSLQRSSRQHLIKQIELSLNKNLYKESITNIQILFQQNAKDTEAMYLMAKVLYALEKFQLASGYLKDALQLKPAHKAKFLQLLKLVQEKIITVNDLESFHLKKLADEPQNLKSLIELGNYYLNKSTLLKDKQSSAKYFRQAYEIAPTDSNVNYGLAMADYALTRSHETLIKFLPKVSGLAKTEQLKVYNLLANAYIQKKRFDDAQQILNQLLKENLEFDADTYLNISYLQYLRGDIKLALENIEIALKLNPNSGKINLNKIAYLHYLPDVEHDQILNAAKNYYEKCLKYDSEMKPINKIFSTKQLSLTKTGLKVAFVSGDLKNHALSFFVNGLFNRLRDLGLQTYAYMTLSEDDYSDRLKSGFDSWCNVENLDDYAFINLVKKDKIDVLFDLSGHTIGSRVHCFTKKLAPVQVTWLGQAGPLGIPQIDYMISDMEMVKPDEINQYIEKPYYLPNHLTAYNAKAFLNLEPCSAFQKNGFITLGSFNNSIKINEATLAIWAEILNKSDVSTKLYFKNAALDKESERNRILKFFLERGVSEHRIILEGLSDKHTYLQCFNKVDLALDPFPLGGGTTTHDTLLMSVPVVTLYGKTFSHRTTASILKQLNEHELVASNKLEYIELVLQLIQKPERLLAYKNSLRDKYLKSALVDMDLFAADFSKAIRDMWRKTLAQSGVT